MLNFNYIIGKEFSLIACSFFKRGAYELNSRTERFIPRGRDLLFLPTDFKHSSHILKVLRSTALLLVSYLISGFDALSLGVARLVPEKNSGSERAARDLSLIPWESTRHLRPTVHNTVSVETATLEVGITPLTPVPSKLSGLPCWSSPAVRHSIQSLLVTISDWKNKEPLAGIQGHTGAATLNAKGSLYIF